MPDPRSLTIPEEIIRIYNRAADIFDAYGALSS